MARAMEAAGFFFVKTNSTEVANYGDKSMVKSEIKIFHDVIG